MIITICASMDFAKEIQEAEAALLGAGYVVFVPEGVRDYIHGKDTLVGGLEGAERKITLDLIRRHYEKIKISDAILVLNHLKSGVPNYIGGNTFAEMCFAHVLYKPIFLMNPIPDIPFYKDEMDAMQPTILNGNLATIL